MKEEPTTRHREEETKDDDSNSNGNGNGNAGEGSNGASGGAGLEKVGFFKLFSFADRKDIVLMAMGVVGAVANGLASPLMTYIFGDMIDTFGVADRSSIVQQVSKVVLRFVYLAFGIAAAAFLQVSCWMVSGERQAARIRSLYLKTILRQDVTFFDVETTTGEVIGRMSGDTILIQDAMGEKVGKFLQLFATFVGGFVVAFTRGWLLSLVMMSSMSLVVVAGAVVSLIISRLSIRSQTAYSEAGNIVQQTIGSIRTVVSFTGEKQAIEKYDKQIVTAYKSAVSQGTATGVGIGFVLFTLFSSYGLAVWYGSKMIIEKGYNGGTVFSVMVSIFVGGMSLGQTTPCLNAFTAGQVAAYKMFQTIERKPLIDSYDTKGRILEDIKGDIELRNVYFSYPARPQQLVFDGFSLFVPSGTTMALVGESGSGKSTVISLVERFYDPKAGEVLVDGVNLKNLSLKWIRQQIGLVGQEPVLFATTIRENIMYGKDGATDKDIRTTIELANAANFIDKMPRGLDTMVGEHGTQLSGGQKQRIAISRAILKNPKILLLDEATSALDAESERIVQDALERIMGNRTTIIVAHRLSTVQNSDAISVVHRGKLIEQGSHAELIKNPEGAYSQLVRLQERKKDEDAPSHTSEGPKPLDKSGSVRSSFKKSMSRGGSSRRSSLASLVMPFGLPGAGSVNGREFVVDEEDEEQEDHDDDKLHKPVPITRLAGLNKPELPVILLGAAVACVNGSIMPVSGMMLASVIKMFYEPPNALSHHSKFWALIYLALGLVSLVVVPLQNFLFGVAGAKLVRRIRSLSFEKVVHQEISWFDEPSNSSGSIGARLSSDASSVRTLVGDSLALAVQNMATLVVGFVVAFVSNWKLSLVIIAPLPLLVLQGCVQMKYGRGFSADAKAKYEEASQVANDAVSSIRTVASFCAEEKIMDTYEKKCEAPVKDGVRKGITSAIGFGLSFLVLYCTYALCFYVGARFIRDGQATFGQLFRVFFALTLAATGISQSSTAGPDANKAKDSTASIFAIIDRKSKIDSSSDEGTVLQNVRGDITLKHIRFKYSTRPDVQIFRDLSLHVPAGKTVALVGESGSGKSTVIALLERFYDPDSGTVLLDGVDIKTLNIRWLRQQMGLVSQEPALFNDSIGANIAYGKQGDVSEEEIIVAAKAANAHEFISALPEGYKTNVGEHGTQMSGGQKQRIAIARAILKDPRLLLLDEATSALDTNSERIVQETLDRVMVGRTTVVVAHRLSTIKGADIIAVVKNGVIAEQGRHEQLMGIANGAYASLVALHTAAK